MGNFLLFLGLIALIAFWLDGMSARERAVSAAHNACKRNELLFLDQTVVLAHLSLQRHNTGRLTFQRRYDFEFLADDDETRHGGSVVLLGRKIESLTLELPDHTLHDVH